MWENLRTSEKLYLNVLRIIDPIYDSSFWGCHIGGLTLVVALWIMTWWKSIKRTRCSQTWTPWVWNGQNIGHRIGGPDVGCFSGMVGLYTSDHFGAIGYFFHMLGIIIPTDLHIFQRGRAQPPTSNDSHESFVIFWDAIAFVLFLHPATRSWPMLTRDVAGNSSRNRAFAFFPVPGFDPVRAEAGGAQVRGPPDAGTNAQTAKGCQKETPTWRYLKYGTWCGCRNWPIIGSFTAIIWCNWVCYFLTYTLATKYHNNNMFHISFCQRGLLWHCWTFHHLSPSYNLAGTKHLVES